MPASTSPSDQPRRRWRGRFKATPLVWSLGLHAALLLLVVVPIYRGAKSAPMVVATVDVVAAAELEPPPPPAPSEFEMPERREDEVTPRDTSRDDPDPMETDWNADLDDEMDDRVREVISCPDPRGASARFRPAKRRPVKKTAAPAAGPIGPVAVKRGAGDAEASPPAPMPPRPAAILAHVAPRYPSLARRRGIEGNVKLSVVIEADGSIGSIEVVESSGSAVLDRAAVAAVREWEFRPAEVRGHPVRATLELPPIRFKLTD